MPDTAVPLIPGTALPMHTTGGDLGYQNEGRGLVGGKLAYGPSLLEKLGDRDDVSPHELAYIAHALRALNTAPKQERCYYVSANGNADATTGNLALMLFQAPAGFETHVTQCTFDVHSTTITPSAPFSNAAAFAFLAIGPENSTTTASADVDTLRRGAVAFAPSSAGGPFIPGQWTFNDSSAPIAYGGSAVYLVVHGGSAAALLGLTFRARVRVNLKSSE